MKLIIDIPDKVYANAKNGELNEIQSMYICGSVCNGIPYDEKPQEDLISRSALKKVLCEEYEAREHYIGEIMLKAVDNAPTVDIESVKSELNPTVTCWYDFDRGYEKGYERGKSERPQGEWIGGMKCSVCGEFSNDTGNFCSNCGADMRKGSELYREENCDRKSHCDDYKRWHCIGCNNCKKGGAE